MAGNEIATIKTAPAFATPAKPETMSDQMKLMAMYVTSPRLKVMQGIRRGELKTEFEEGDCVAMPMQQLIIPAGGVFHFAPLMFYPEWLCVNPIELGGQMIRRRTLEVTDEVAIKARDQDRRSEPHPDVPRKDGKDMFIRYVECLNFVVMILEPENPLFGIGLTLSFARGEHKQGSKLSSLIRMRKVEEPYACRFEARVGPRKNDKGEWVGLNVDNPRSGEPWVTTEQFDAFRPLHETYVKAYTDRLLKVEYDDELAGDADQATANAAASKKF